MRYLKPFEEFLKEGVIKKVAINRERAKSLVLGAERKMSSLKEYLEKIGIKDENANDYVEYCYNILMNLIRAKLLLDGYSSSGNYSHEAEISYLRKLEFKEIEVQFMNEMRYLRNSILYYGQFLDKEYAEKVIDFLNKNYKRFINLVK